MAYREAAAQAATTLLMSDQVFKQAKRIACYFAQKSEFDCTSIITRVCQQDKECYLPVLSLLEKSLQFMAYRPNDPLRPNQYHILEPYNQALVAAEILDIVLVPLVGFDEHGNRLGMGGGYYDRTFAFLQNQQAVPHKPYLLGLGYELQKMDCLMTESWDIKLDGILTEKKLHWFYGPHFCLL